MSYRLSTDLSWNRTLEDLEETFRLWRVNDWSVHCDLPHRYADKYSQTPKEREVGLRYTKDGQEFHLTMSRQSRAVDNLRVLYLAVEAMRLNDLRGITDIIREAYLQLPAPPKYRDPYEILEVRPDAAIEVIEAAYRALAKRLHPDAGGSVEAMQELNQAFERIKEERGVKV